jgi:DNA-directed RNA polymerase subunit omega
MKEVNQMELMTKVDSQFKLVVMAAKRVKSLSHGAQRLTGEGDPNLIRVALKEIRQGKITYENEKE